MGLPGVMLPHTEVRVVHSRHTGSDYQISVAMPFHYDDRPDQRWPVIYVLDGNLYFGLVVDMVRAMNIRVEFCDELPDAFVVGIGYPVEGSLSTMLHEVMHRRLADFLPRRDEGAEAFIQESFPLPTPSARSGRAAAFLRFLQEELVPVLDEAYRVDPEDRTLLGHSWGATFAFYTLFRKPRLFRRYVIVSSGADPEDEANYARDHDDLAARVHVVMERSEPEVANLERLLHNLEARRYSGLGLSHELLDRTHCAIVAPAFQAGLVEVFT